MIKTFSSALSDKMIRSRLMVTLGLIIMFQFGTNIPLPSVQASTLLKTNPNALVTFANITSGGGLSSFGLLALGVSPYVTASIVVQLLSQGISKKYTLLSEQGQLGRQKLATRTRIFTLIFGFMQGIAILSAFDILGYLGYAQDLQWLDKVLIAGILAMGGLFTSYLGELINDKGIGNGLSVIIVSGILVQLPNDIVAIYNNYISGELSTMYLLLTIILAIIVVVFTLIINQAHVQLPLQSTKHSQVIKSHYLPIKVMAGSIIPVIFASSVVSLLALIPGFDLSSPLGLFIFGVLIISFSYIYNIVQIDPEKLSKNLKESGTYIIGVEPQNTESYIIKLIIKLTHIGAPSLVIITLLPMFLGNYTNIMVLGALSGTGLLITTTVLLELYSQIKNLTTKANYQDII